MAGRRSNTKPRRAARAAIGAGLLGLAGCGPAELAPEQRIPLGDPRAGRAAVMAVACGVCHTIPGVPGAYGIVGPSLAGFGKRHLIGGVIPNRPATLIQWVSDAPSLIPATGMPELPLTDEQARDVAAFLFTLR